ncbi:MAG: dienelactone hydrolase family protein [Bryobacteraceae bacterium]
MLHLYVDGGLTRRQMWSRLTKLAGGSAAAMTILEGHGLAQVQTQACPAGIKVAENDPAVQWQDITYPGEAGNLFGHLARPAGQRDPQPAVIVVHENRGLVEHIRDVTRRAAKAGFVALGVDLLSRQGGTGQFKDDTERGLAYGRTETGQRFNDIAMSVEYLQRQPFVVWDRIGIIGFCAGGGNIIHAVMNRMNLQAAVPFYGGLPAVPLPPAEDITTPMLAIYSETDRAQAGRIGELANHMVNARVTFGIQLYKGTGHGFHNDTGAVYNPEAACDAWAKAMAFFNTHLRAPRA